MHHKQKGFSLIELMVVMMIIAVLSGLALVSIAGSRKGARDARRKADLEEIRAALEMCKADTGSYPTPGWLATVNGTQSIVCGGVTYLTGIGDPGAYGYRYRPGEVDGVAVSYNLCSRLENDTGDNYDFSICGGNCNGVVCNYRVTQP